MNYKQAIGVLACLLATSASADQFDGLYRPAGAAYENWSCEPRDIGMDGGALSIGDGYLDGVENRCELRNPRVSASGTATKFTAVCSAEGSEYREDVVIARTSNGVSITRNDNRVEWTRCDQPAAQTVLAPATDNWNFVDRTASIVSGGNAFSMSCDTYNASSTYPTATISVPCPTCFPGETNSYTLSVDDQFIQTYEFERISNAKGSQSGLDYYPAWNEGLVGALMAGSKLDVLEDGAVIASFPLSGSSRAIAAMRDACN
ncbi:hypothetical protein [Yoonia sp. R2-816]|uniref:hypothetical protein n=1 Tax=Yoonia sp. R2-816 TaxID=3342638 RepID=UPI00372B1DEA